MIRRTLLTASLVVLTTFTAASTASAAVSYDREFNTVDLGSMGRFAGQAATSCEYLLHKRLAISGVGTVNRYGKRGTVDSATYLGTMMVDVRGRTGKSLTHKWVSAGLPRGYKLYGSDFANAGAGAFAYIAAPRSDKRSSKFSVVKRGASGRAAWRFGRSGKVSFALPPYAGRNFWTFASVLTLSDGGILAAVSRPDKTWLIRFTARGKRAKWGRNGVVQLPPNDASGSWFLPGNRSLPMLEMSPDRILVASSGRPSDAPNKGALGLLALNRAGNIDSSFAENGLWLPPTPQPTVDATPPPSRVIDIDHGESGVSLVFGWAGTIPIGRTFSFRFANLGPAGETKLISDPYGGASSGGDIGFPDGLPFEFGNTIRGPVMVSTFLQYASDEARYWGEAGMWPSAFFGGVTSQQISSFDRFAPNDFALNPEGDSMYACGALNTTPKTTKGWAKHRAVIRRMLIP